MKTLISLRCLILINIQVKSSFHVDNFSDSFNTIEETAPCCFCFQVNPYVEAKTKRQILSSTVSPYELDGIEVPRDHQGTLFSTRCMALEKGLG